MTEEKKSEEKKKVAIVTGGTRGIGRAISQQLIEDGYKVVAIYNGNKEAAKAFEAETGHKAYQLDVADFAACQEKVQQIETKLGPIHVLVNNAGITRDRVFHKMEADSWHEVIETNLSSCFNMCRAVILGMRERKAGRIINISSINGQKGQFGQTNYSAAKAGMLGFTKALAQENAGRKITVNAICPGYIETDMTSAISADVLQAIINQIPVGRMGKTDEIAAAVSFLTSEKSAFITGATLSVNGGQYMV
jgi:acetoacetyl-CoA reductase